MDKPSKIPVVIDIKNDYPLFGEISDMLVSDSKMLLQLKLYKTISYDQQFHSFVLEKTSCSQLLDLQKLFVPYPFIIRYISHIGKFLVVMKYHNYM